MIYLTPNSYMESPTGSWGSCVRVTDHNKINTAENSCGITQVFENSMFMPLSVYGYGSRLTWKPYPEVCFAMYDSLFCQNTWLKFRQLTGEGCRFPLLNFLRSFSTFLQPDPSERWHNHGVFQPLLPVLYQLQTCGGCTGSYRMLVNVLITVGSSVKP